MLFENQAGENTGAYSASRLTLYANRLELDLSAFDGCMETGGGAERMRLDLADAETLGVGSIPSVFINGVRLDGLRAYSEYRSAIEAELARPR